MTPDKHINIGFEFTGKHKHVPGISTRTHTWSGFSRSGNAQFWTLCVGRATVNMTTGAITGACRGQASPDVMDRLRALWERGHVTCVCGGWSADTLPAAFYVHMPWTFSQPALRKAVSDFVIGQGVSKGTFWSYEPAPVTLSGLHMFDYAQSTVVPHYSLVDGAIVPIDGHSTNM